MTEPTAGQAHPEPNTLADLDAGVLDGAPGEADLRAHVAGCADCARQAALLVDARSLLGDLPAPPLPPDVVGRLDTALAAEARRTDGRPGRPGRPEA